MRENVDALFPLMAGLVVVSLICIPYLGLWGLAGVILAIYVTVNMTR